MEHHRRLTSLPHVHPVDFDALENEINHGPPPLEDIGRLSADAVLEQFKMAAKAVEEMGEEVQARVRALQDALKECDEDLKLLTEAAAAIREKGNHAHIEIERTAAVSKDIRAIVATIKERLK